MSAPLPPQPGELSAHQRIARLVFVFIVLGLGLWTIRNFLPALLWAGVIAIAISPLRHRVIRRWPSLSRGWVLPFLLTAAVALLVLVPVGFGIVRAAAEAQDVARWLIAARHQGVPVPEWVAHLPFGAKTVSAWWQQHLATPEAADEQFRVLSAQTILYHSRMVGSGIIKRSITFGFTLFALFFLLRDGAFIAAQIRLAARRLIGASGDRIANHVVQSVRGTIDGLVLVGLAEGLLMAVAYVFSGVTHPLLLGAATAIAAMIPFGAAAMYCIAGLLLITQQQVVAAIAVVAFGFAVVFVADHVVRPVLIGGATRLPFLWVLLGILGGVETFGLLGLFVGPAVMAVLVMLWREWVAAGTRGAEMPPAR
ncbi:MAG: AI-2E family transporter [Sphingomonadaceae bacterium]|nr:AI-2E family transporter [Sphingomonadaceae bacterium]